MSNLMRRVRGSDQPPGGPAPVEPALLAGVEPRIGASAETASEELTASIPTEPEIELDANGMLRLVRKGPATDLSALREIANSSARTAIARHRQRRNAESAVSKAVVCALASAASAYLMATAPGINSFPFWGGCATLAAALGTGLQLVVVLLRRISLGKDVYAPSTGADFSPLTQAVGEVAVGEPAVG